jgi:phospho-2-dehydro-3-deoxyheptonate aldolase
MIDASHANSRKIPARQIDVARDVATQVARGNRGIFGIMLESNLVEGRQNVVAGQPLVYGQSITDPCIDWASTEGLLAELAGAVRAGQAQCVSGCHVNGLRAGGAAAAVLGCWPRTGRIWEPGR